MDLNIIEKIETPLKEFKTVDEFNLYYTKHKEEMDSLTTHKLNKMYLINGYRITKIKGVLSLKKPYVSKKEEVKDEVIAELRDEIATMKQQIINLTKTVNLIVETLNKEN